MPITAASMPLFASTAVMATGFVTTVTTAVLVVHMSTYFIFSIS